MFHIFIAVLIFSLLFSLLLFSVAMGRRFAKWQVERHSLGKIETINVVEGAIFGLLGLMVAFTFSGAYERFEARKTHIVEEANVVETAYLMLDLLTPSATPDLRNNFRLYVDTRLSAYKDIPNFNAVYRELRKSKQLQGKIWNQVLAACKITNDQTVTQLLIPAITTMFETENTGIAITQVHPPAIVFELLLGLAMLSSFLSGYATVEKKVRDSIYNFIYIGITAFIIYMIIDLEFPRMGLIRVDSFDQVLMDVRNTLN